MSVENIKLGVMPPLTGLVGIYGSEIMHAAHIACQEINENGGVLGRPLELIFEDDGSLPDTAVNAAKKLLDEHECSAIIGNLLSNSRIAVAYSVAEPRRIPYLNFSFYEGSILSRYFFHFAALPNQQIDKMIPYMCEKFGPRMFFAGNNYEWPRGSIHAGKRVLEENGGEVVGEEYCPIGVSEEDIDKLLDLVEAEKPDVFVPYFAGNDQVLLLTRFTERGLKDHIVVVMGHYDEMMASQLSQNVREGFYSTNTYFMSVDSEHNRNYKSRLANLQDVNGIWPKGNGILTNFGEGTYVCVKAFAAAANKAGSVESELLVEELRTINIEAPQGLVSMESAHHHARVNTYLTQCDSEGEFKIIENFGVIDPVLPERYNNQRISNQATLEDDIRLQARMLEQLSEGIVLVSTSDASILYANAGAYTIFEYDGDDLLGLDVAMLFNKDIENNENHYKDILTIINKKGGWEGEIDGITKNGVKIVCSLTSTIFTHPVFGEVVLAVYRDITKNKYSEKELRESEARYKRAEQGTNDGLWEWNILTGEDYFSPRWLAILGYKPKELAYHLDTFIELIHPDDLPVVSQVLEKHLQNNSAYDVDMRMRHKRNGYIWINARGQAERNVNGEPVRMSGFITNIHDRKVTEFRERLKHKISQAITNALSVYVSDMESVRGIFIHLLQELLNITESEYGFIGEVFYSDNGNPYLKTLAITDVSWNEETRSFYEERSPVGMEFTNLDSLFGHTLKTGEYTISNDPIHDVRSCGLPEGHPVLNTFLCVPLKIAGELIGMIGIANRKDGYSDDIIVPLESFFQSCANVISSWRDTQKRIKVETELREYKDRLEVLVEERTEELHKAQSELVRKERLATLGQLTATVSHELRNPLCAMRPSLHIIQKKSDQDDQRLQQAVELIDRNIERCDNIIDELLDFTRITELNLSSVRLDKWLELEIQEQVIPAGLQVHTDLGLNELELDIDIDRLRRAFINVFINAYESMMDCNKKLIETNNARVTILTRRNNNHANIIVEDSGPGIAEEVLDKIFEPLYSTKGFGVGLGMPTVKQIMEQHGGGIEIISAKGNGARIILWLPIKQHSKNEGNRYKG